MQRLVILVLLAACKPNDDSAISDDTGESAVSVVLPQAVAGAMWANPTAYPQIPVRVTVTGSDGPVTVELDGAATAAEDLGDGGWLAMVPIADLAPGEHTLTASVDGSEPTQATLVLGSEGIQFTWYDLAGSGNTPRLHAADDRLWLSWTDRSAGLAEAWLQPIDGAGRELADKVALVGAAEETLYARTALGADTMAVLYQAGGSPYVNHLLISDLEGNILMQPLDLDPEGTQGSYSGDVAWDGSGFVVVWRTQTSSGDSSLWWMRVDESNHEIAGPVELAVAGAGTYDEVTGGFDPFVHLSIAANGERSVVGWVQYRWHNIIAMALPYAYLALLQPDGTVVWSEVATDTTDMTWARECRVFPSGSGFTAAWSEVDLMGDGSSNWIHAVRLEGDEPPGRAVPVVDEVDDRDEPFLVASPDLPGLMAWWDQRAYTEDPANASIRLYAADVDANLERSDEL